MIDHVPDEAAHTLNCWPDGTVGYFREAELIGRLLGMCREHGYGRVGQLAAQIEDLWRHPERMGAYLEAREEHLRLAFSGPGDERSSPP